MNSVYRIQSVDFGDNSVYLFQPRSQRWHGSGYGGTALSLRETVLDAEGLKLVIRCGRPNTRMPFHERSAYKGDSTDCYDVTKQQLGEQAPPWARKFIREPQVDAVVDYVLNTLKGKGEPISEECIAYWGDGARQCKSTHE